jgi:hypothetical protein
MTIASNDAVVEVRSSVFGLGAFVRRNIPAGTLLAAGWGMPAPCRTKHSIQVDDDRHLNVDPPLVYLNHSCDPNCGLLIDRRQETLQLRSLRSLREGEELSLDYDTFEHEIEYMPKQCMCGSQNCRGRIKGFKHLSLSRAEGLIQRFQDYVADYLRAEFATRRLEVALPAETLEAASR